MTDTIVDDWEEPIVSVPRPSQRKVPSLNPLAGYFRKPGLCISLPSKGHFNPDIQMTMTGEVQISPMTAADEILLKNPDALLNGSAIEHVIKSCAPSVGDPRELPAIDVDAIILAIKAATTGDVLSIDAKCPKCGFEGTVAMSIRNAIESAAPLEPEYIVRLEDDLLVSMRPHTYYDQTKLSLATFKEAKRLQLLDNDPTVSDDTKQKEVIKAMNAVNKVSNDMLASCVIQIIAGDTVVTDKKHIREFMDNCSASYINQLNMCMNGMAGAGIYKKHPAQCSECNHEWETDVAIDPSHFFE